VGSLHLKNSFNNVTWLCVTVPEKLSQIEKRRLFLMSH